MAVRRKSEASDDLLELVERLTGGHVEHVRIVRPADRQEPAVGGEADSEVVGRRAHVKHRGEGKLSRHFTRGHLPKADLLGVLGRGQRPAVRRESDHGADGAHPRQPPEAPEFPPCPNVPENDRPVFTPGSQGLPVRGEREGAGFSFVPETRGPQAGDRAGRKEIAVPVGALSWSFSGGLLGSRIRLPDGSVRPLLRRVRSRRHAESLATETGTDRRESAKGQQQDRGDLDLAHERRLRLALDFA